MVAGRRVMAHWFDDHDTPPRTRATHRPPRRPRPFAAATPTDRNRAVDLYRAAAMAVVAVGHWLGMVVVIEGGEVTGGNLLDWSPQYGWITWIGQVMPLFFFVGGFASATSLRSAERRGVRPADWIATRLHRMVTPAAALAAALGHRTRGGCCAGRRRRRRRRCDRRGHPVVVPGQLHDRHRAGAVHLQVVPCPTCAARRWAGRAVRSGRDRALRRHPPAAADQLGDRLARFPGRRIRVAGRTAPHRAPAHRVGGHVLGTCDARGDRRAVAGGDAAPRRAGSQPDPSAVDRADPVRSGLLVHRCSAGACGDPLARAFAPGLAGDDRRERRGDVGLPLAHDRGGARRRAGTRARSGSGCRAGHDRVVERPSRCSWRRTWWRWS